MKESNRQMNDTLPTPQSDAIKKLLRCAKKDSAFLYAIFEAQEGMMTVSTAQTTATSCDLELQIPPAMLEDSKKLLEQLEGYFYELIYEPEKSKV